MARQRKQRKPEQAGTAPKAAGQKQATARDTRQPLADTAGNQAVTDLVTGAAREDGDPLDPALAGFLSRQLGEDVADARIHRGGQAERVTAAHEATAVTQGTEIYVGGDAPPLDSAAGVAILAHEAAHVAQNARGATGQPSQSRSMLEGEAALATDQLASGQAPSLQGAASPGMALTLTKEDRKRRSKIGALIGAGIGVLGGIAIVAAGGLALGPILGALGAVAGGAGLGALIGYFKRRSTPVTVKESDKLIRGRYGQHLQAQIVAGLSAANSNLKVVDDATFKAAYQATGMNMDRYETVGGFVDRSTNPPTVWIHKERQKTVTVLHEAVHLYSNPALRHDATVVATIQAGNMVNEGFTHYFTEQIADEQYLDKSGIATDYGLAAKEVRALAGLVGEDTLRHAYFEGDVAGLRAAFDAIYGAGACDAWITAMNNRDWTLARRIVKRGPP